MNNIEVNDAIIECLTIGPKSNWDYKSKLQDNYSKETVQSTLEILDFVNEINPNFENESFNEFLCKVATALKREYSFLNEEAIKTLVARISYDWK